MKRSLGFWQLLAAIYFCVSGGAFGLEPVVQLGPGLAILLILVTPIIWSAPAALMTAELACAIPEEGGYYVWVKRALGQPWGFLCGWWSWVFTWVDVAIYPTLFAVYVGRFLEVLGYAPAIADHPNLKWGIGLVIIVPLTLLNLLGTKLAGESSLAFFVILLAPFVALVALGMSRVLMSPSATIHPFVATGDGAKNAFGVGLFALMWNYLGWDSISTVAGEVRDPQKTFSRALAIGVPLVAASYLLPVLVGVVVLRDSKLWDDGAWVQVASLVGGKWLAISIAAAGIVSSAGLFGATLLTGSRIPFVLAEDGFLPKSVAKLHPRFGTPWVAILTSAVFYTAFSYGSFKDLAVIDVVLYSAALILEFIALAVLRRKEPNMPRPFRIPGGSFGIACVCLAPTALIVFACVSRFQEKGEVALGFGHVMERGQVAMWTSAIALASGPVVWLLGRWWQNRTSTQSPPERRR